MHSFNSEPKTDIQVKNNWKVINRSLDSHVNLPKLRGIDFVADPALPGSNNNVTYPYAYHEFLNGADERAVQTLRREERWRNGIIRFRKMWYSGTAAGNNYLMQFALHGHRNGVGLGAPTYTVATNVLIPGPTGANILMSYDFSTVNTFFITCDSSIDELSFNVRRIGTNVADTNAGLFQLIDIDYEYLEKTGDIGDNFDKPVVY